MLHISKGLRETAEQAPGLAQTAGVGIQAEESFWRTRLG
jgi:hypothetical protein